MDREIITSLDADAAERELWNLSGGLRIDALGGLTLVGKPGSYAINTWYQAESPTVSIGAAREWIAIEFVHEHKRPPDSPYLATEIEVRLRVSGALIEWDGAAWIPAVGWMTFSQASSGIAELPLGPTSVVIRMRTSDARVAPTLSRIKLAVLCYFEHLEDYVWRSLLHRMKQEIRPVARIDATADGTNKVTPRNPESYAIKSIDEARDVGTAASPSEPGPNLFGSYDANTGIVTLSQNVTAGRIVRLWVRHQVATTAVATSLDFFEANSAPAIGISNVVEVERGQLPDRSAINHHDSIGIVVPGPAMSDVTFDIEVTAGKEWDLLQLKSELQRFFGEGSRLTSEAMGEEFDMQITNRWRSQAARGIRGLHRGSMAAQIVSALFFDRRSRIAYGVIGFATSPASNLEI